MSVPLPPLFPEAVLIVVAVTSVLLLLLVAIRFVSRQICSNFLGHAWRPDWRRPRRLGPSRIGSLNSTSRASPCLCQEAAGWPVQHNAFLEEEGLRWRGLSQRAVRARVSMLNTRCPGASFAPPLAGSSEVDVVLLYVDASVRHTSHIHIASSTPRRPQARLRMARNRHNTDTRGQEQHFGLNSQ